MRWTTPLSGREQISAMNFQTYTKAMKNKLKLHKMEPHSQQWHDFRTNGIGGSEVSTILDLNPYASAARMFHEKIGTISAEKIYKESMFWGTQHEDKVAEIWQYFDGNEDGYIHNWENNNIIRKCKKVNGYVTNPDYPWLFASADRLINKEGGYNMITGKPLQDECILECKTLSHFAAKAWEGGIPIYYIAQIHQYMLIFEVDYAEIAILKDGNKFDVVPVQRDERLIERILSLSKAFWYERVLPAREAFKNSETHREKGETEQMEEQESVIQQLEPDPDGTESYKEFMAERFVKEEEFIDGTEEMLALCKTDEIHKTLSKFIDKKRSLYKNQITKIFIDNSVEKIDFGGNGYAKYYTKKNAKQPTLDLRISDKPSGELIESIVDKIDFEY